MTRINIIILINKIIFIKLWFIIESQIISVTYDRSNHHETNIRIKIDKLLFILNILLTFHIFLFFISCKSYHTYHFFSLN